MIDGGAVSPNLHNQVDRSSGNGGGSSMCGPTAADRDILVYQQLANLINAGYSEVSTHERRQIQMHESFMESKDQS